MDKFTVDIAVGTGRTGYKLVTRHGGGSSCVIESNWIDEKLEAERLCAVANESGADATGLKFAMFADD